MTRAQSSTSDLVPDATYLSPAGRACRLAPGQEPLSRAAEAYMLYDTPTGRPARGSMADGFSLTRANWYVLRRVA
jgi:hypothetical protein